MTVWLQVFKESSCFETDLQKIDLLKYSVHYLFSLRTTLCFVRELKTVSNIRMLTLRFKEEFWTKYGKIIGHCKHLIALE